MKWDHMDQCYWTLIAGGYAPMDYDDDARLFNFVTGLVFGAVLGAGIALVMAPSSGKRTRRRIQRAAGDLRHSATDRWDDIADEVRERVEEALDGAKRRVT